MAMSKIARKPRACTRCGQPCSRKRTICAECESRWTGTHYAKQPAKDGDAMLKRLPGSFGTGKKR
jgi:hypothetical protein